MLLTQTLLDSNFTTPIKLEEVYTIRLVKNIMQRDNSINSFYIGDNVSLPISDSDINYNYISTTSTKEILVLHKLTDIVYPINTVFNVNEVQYKITKYLSLVDTTSPKELLCLVVPVDVETDVTVDSYNESAKATIHTYMNTVLDSNNNIIKLAPSTIDLKKVYTKEYIDALEYKRLTDSLKINMYDRILDEIRYYGIYVPDDRFSVNTYNYEYCGTLFKSTLYSFIFWLITDPLINFNYLYIPYVHIDNLTTVTDYNTKISLVQQSNNNRKFKVEPVYTTSYYEIDIKDFSITALDTTSNSYAINDLSITIYNADGTSSAVNITGDTQYSKLVNILLKIIKNS